MGFHQVLDAFGRMVETFGQESDFILPGLGNPHGEIAFAPFFNAVLQQLQAAREFADDRVGGQRHRHRHQRQGPEKPVRRQVPG